MKLNKIFIIIELIIFVFLFQYTISLLLQVNSSREQLNKLKSSLNLLSDPTIQTNGMSFIGTVFTDINANDIYGIPYSLHSDQAIMKLVVFFNTKDCAGCLNEYRLWKHVYRVFPHDKLSVIGICNDVDINNIISFIKEREIDFPIIHDPNNAIRTSMQLRFSPLRIILDNYNNILQIARAGLNNSEQKAFIKYLEDTLSKGK